MTLVINGLLLEPIYKWIAVYAKPTETQSLLYHSMEEVELMSQRATSRLRSNWFFHNLEWDLIDNIVGDLRIIEFGDNFDFKPFEKFARMKYLVASLIIQLSQSEDL